MVDRSAQSLRVGRRQGALVTALLLGLLAGCGGDDADPGTGSSTSTQPTSTATDQPTVTATVTSTVTTTVTATATSTTTSGPTASSVVPVYFVIDSRAGLRLARELHPSSGDPVAAAVEAMVAGPDDPDYTTTWDPGTQVLGVEQDGDTVVVDLSADALTANVGSEGAELMVQQLVYTVAGATGSDVAVQLLIEGEPPADLWGAVSWLEPVSAADPLDVRLLVQIDEPLEGAQAPSPLTVSGDAAVFEATLLWRVLDDQGEVIASGFTMTAEGQTFAPYSFTVELQPGDYTVVIDEGDPSGEGAGGEPMTDSRAVTVP